MLEAIPQNPLFWACAVVAVFGLVTHYLYSGWINENYRSIKWFRRMFLPHLTPLLEDLDEDTEADLSKLYVETSVGESEHTFDINIPESQNYEGVLYEIEEKLKSKHFRPEVLLTSVASNPDGKYEVGNWVLTAPEKNHSDVPAYGVLSDVFKLLVSEWQLHVRIYWNEEERKLEFYAHYEKNPYSPIHSEDHFNAVGMDHSKGRKLLLKNMTLNSNKYDFEVIHD